MSSRLWILSAIVCILCLVPMSGADITNFYGLRSSIGDLYCEMSSPSKIHGVFSTSMTCKTICEPSTPKEVCDRLLTKACILTQAYYDDLLPRLGDKIGKFVYDACVIRLETCTTKNPPPVKTCTTKNSPPVTRTM